MTFKEGDRVITISQGSPRRWIGTIKFLGLGLYVNILWDDGTETICNTSGITKISPLEELALSDRPE